MRRNPSRGSDRQTLVESRCLVTSLQRTGAGDPNQPDLPRERAGDSRVDSRVD
jgi:hypothetical protein